MGLEIGCVMNRVLVRLIRGQRGFTLVELTTAIAIVGIIVLGITMAISQVLVINAGASNHMIAVRQVQQAGKELSQDTLQAQTIVRGVAQGFPLKLTWTAFGSDITHEVVYDLEPMPGGSADTKQLRRDYTEYTDGTLISESSRIIARYIVLADTTCEEPEPGKLVFTITASVGGDPPYEGRETRVYEAKRRTDVSTP